jgi:hypothetical protein
MITSTDDKISARVSAIMQDYKNNLLEELKLEHPIIYIDGKEVDTNIYIFLLKQILKQNDLTPETWERITQNRLSGYEEEILEPIRENEESCSWCQIDESCREAASARNSFRALAHAGMLKSYIKSMREIGRKYKEG